VRATVVLVVVMMVFLSFSSLSLWLCLLGADPRFYNPVPLLLAGILFLQVCKATLVSVVNSLISQSLVTQFG
jgi:hypothetical protein